MALVTSRTAISALQTWFLAVAFCCVEIRSNRTAISALQTCFLAVAFWCVEMRTNRTAFSALQTWLLAFAFWCVEIRTRRRGRDWRIDEALFIKSSHQFCCSCCEFRSALAPSRSHNKSFVCNRVLEGPGRPKQRETEWPRTSKAVWSEKKWCKLIKYCTVTDAILPCATVI